jgi:hypothetical protein
VSLLFAVSFFVRLTAKYDFADGEKIRTHGKVGIFGMSLQAYSPAKIECRRVCKHSIFPCAFVSAFRKKPLFHFKIFPYLFHKTSYEEILYITIVHLEKIYNF